MAKKKAQKVKKEKGKKREEKREKKPAFAYDRAVAALGHFVCLYAVFAIAAIIFYVVYSLLSL